MKEFDAVEIAKKQRHLYLLQRVKGQKKLSAAELEELAEYEQMAKAGKQKSEVRNQKSESGADFTTQKAAAAWAGVDVRTVQRWKKAGMPVIDLGAGRVGYTKAMLTKFKKMAEGDALNAKLKTEEIGLKGIKRQTAEIDLGVKKGEYVLAADVERDSAQKIIAAKWVLLSMPDKLASSLVGKSRARIRQIIKDEVYHCLDVLAGKKVKRGRIKK